MEFRQLRHFVAVVQEMHFTRAARRLNIAQSALSASVAGLEAELGLRLFVRTTRRIAMTPAGSALYDKTLIALDAVRQAHASAIAVACLSAGALEIGTVQSLPAFLDLPSLLAEFHARYPGIEVRLRQGSRDHLAEQIGDGRLDLAFLPETIVPRVVRSILIVDEPLMLVCASGHPLAARGSVGLAELAGRDFVDFQPGWGTRSIIDAALSAIGIERRSPFEVSDLATLLALVARGLGIALIPGSVAERADPRLRFLPIAGPPIPWRMMAIHLRDRDDAPPSAAARAMLALLPQSGREAD